MRTPSPLRTDSGKHPGVAFHRLPCLRARVKSALGQASKWKHRATKTQANLAAAQLARCFTFSGLHRQTAHSLPSPLPPRRLSFPSTIYLSRKQWQNQLLLQHTLAGTELQAHQKQAQSSNWSRTSPFPPQALRVMAHARDRMFSACLNKQEERQKRQRRSQSWSEEASNTQGMHLNRYMRGLSSPFQRWATLSLWFVAKVEQHLPESHRGCGSPRHIRFFLRTARLVVSGEKKNLNPIFLVYSIVFTIKFHRTIEQFGLEGTIKIT